MCVNIPYVAKGDVMCEFVREEGGGGGGSVECGGKSVGEEGTQEGVVYTHSTLSSLCSAEVASLAGGSAKL